MPFQSHELIYTSVKAEQKIKSNSNEKKKTQIKECEKKLTQTEAGVALDDCDRPFETAPRGQRLLVTLLFDINLFVLEGENSKQLFVKEKSKSQAAFQKNHRTLEKALEQRMDSGLKSNQICFLLYS